MWVVQVFESFLMLLEVRHQATLHKLQEAWHKWWTIAYEQPCQNEPKRCIFGGSTHRRLFCSSILYFFAIVPTGFVSHFYNQHESTCPERCIFCSLFRQVYRLKGQEVTLISRPRPWSQKITSKASHGPLWQFRCELSKLLNRLWPTTDLRGSIDGDIL